MRTSCQKTFTNSSHSTGKCESTKEESNMNKKPINKATGKWTVPVESEE